MSRCELSGKGPVVKNLVSHSNIKTKFRAQPNVQKKQLFSIALGRNVRFQVATSTIRDMEHVGGLDAYLLTQPNEKLSKRALETKSKIQAQLRKKADPKKAGAKVEMKAEKAAEKTTAKPAATKAAKKSTAKKG